MVFVPHIKCTWRGDLPSGEMWSNSLGLVLDEAPIGEVLPLANVLTSTEFFDDVVASIVAYHARLETRIVADCVLKRVTLAPIDANGHYAGPPREAAVNQAGGAGSGAMPHQIARKVTLEADEDLGRVKGGWYIPRPSNFEFDFSTNLWSATNTSGCRDSVKQLLDELENAPGIDVSSVQVVIASQGRRNKDGSVRMAPKNCKVNRVNVGRRADVQRRRANKISEARVSDATLADNG